MNNIIAKSDVVNQVNAIFEEAIRAKIDQWTDQCCIALLEYLINKGDLPTSDTPEDILKKFKP